MKVAVRSAVLAFPLIAVAFVSCTETKAPVRQPAPDASSSETAHDASPDAPVGAVITVESYDAGVDATAEERAPVEARGPDEALIVLSRTACYRHCPVYTLRIFADGLVTYDGSKFVRERGARSKRIDPAVVRKLVANAQGTRFFHAKPCLPRPTDLPSEELTIRTAPKAKPFAVVKAEAGCTTAEASRFAEDVDAKTESATWVRCPDAAPEPCRSSR